MCLVVGSVVIMAVKSFIIPCIKFNVFLIYIIHPCGSSKYKYKETKHRKHRKLQFDDIIGYTKYILLTIIIFFTFNTFDRQGPHFYNSVDCFIKSPASAKNWEFAFKKIFILFNGISSINSGLFNIILFNKLFLREWLAMHFQIINRLEYRIQRFSRACTIRK